MDVVARLRRGLDEDERRAWAVHDISKCDALLYEDLPADAPPPSAEDCECGYPARLLREVAARRAILAQFDEFLAEAESQCNDPDGQFPAVGPGVDAATRVLRAVVRMLAWAYASELSATSTASSSGDPPASG